MAGGTGTSSGLSVGGIELTGRRIGGIIIGVVALIFVFSNTGEVTLKFLWLNISAPGWLMLLVLLIAGFLVGFMIGRKRYKNG